MQMALIDFNRVQLQLLRLYKHLRILFAHGALNARHKQQDAKIS